MTRIRVWPMPIEPRSELIILGGTKQDKSRALFCMLLPDDGSCYTAAEVVKRVLPHADQFEEYRAHAKALYDLANDKGITGKREGDPGPDNVDASGTLLLGKRGRKQRPRWNARSWQAIISDEIWAWLIQFNQDLSQRSEAHRHQGFTVELYCDLETFQISEQQGEPLNPPTLKSQVEEGILDPGLEQRMPLPTRKSHGYLQWAIIIAAALTLCLLTLQQTGRKQDADRSQAIKPQAESALISSSEIVATKKKLQGISSFDYGINLAHKYNQPKRAVAWFEGLIAVEGESEEYRFGKALSLWSGHDVRGAFQEALLLEASAKTPRIRARVNYLLGQIHTRLCKLDYAIKNFEKALEIYSELELFGGVYLCNISLAQIFISKNPDMVMRHIDAAKLANGKLRDIMKLKPYSDGEMLAVLRDLSFAQGKFKESLDLAKAAAESYKDIETEFWLKTARVGLTQALLGDNVAAMKTARDVEVEATRSNNDHLRHYNALTWFFINQCKNYDVDIYENDILAWSKETDDPRILEVLEFLRKTPCP